MPTVYIMHDKQTTSITRADQFEEFLKEIGYEHEIKHLFYENEISESIDVSPLDHLFMIPSEQPLSTIAVVQSEDGKYAQCEKFDDHNHIDIASHKKFIAKFDDPHRDGINSIPLLWKSDNHVNLDKRMPLPSFLTRSKVSFTFNQPYYLIDQLKNISKLLNLPTDKYTAYYEELLFSQKYEPLTAAAALPATEESTTDSLFKKVITSLTTFFSKKSNDNVIQAQTKVNETNQAEEEKKIKEILNSINEVITNSNSKNLLDYIKNIKAATQNAAKKLHTLLQNREADEQEIEAKLKGTFLGEAYGKVACDLQAQAAASNFSLIDQSESKANDSEEDKYYLRLNH